MLHSSAVVLLGVVIVVIGFKKFWRILKTFIDCKDIRCNKMYKTVAMKNGR